MGNNFFKTKKNKIKMLIFYKIHLYLLSIVKKSYIKAWHKYCSTE